MRSLTVEQMTFCEHDAENYGVSLGALMDNAGAKLADTIQTAAKKFGDNVKIVLLVGKGNNGGDGLVAAQRLFEQGIATEIVLCCGEPDTDLSSAAYKNLDKAVPVISDREQALEKIASADIIVDCIFGTGFHGALRDNVKPIFVACAKSKAYKIACDLPSGTNARNGEADELSFKADETITFHMKKLGMSVSPAKNFVGNCHTADINIPKECSEKLSLNIQMLDIHTAASYLPKRPSDGHKGTFGKVVSVCGSERYIGAAGLSALSAMRTGVGLFELCTAKSVVNSLSSKILECTYAAMKTDDDGFMTSVNAETILEKCRGAKCLLVGCGLGHTAETEKLVAKLVANAEIPLIIDADGINSLVPNIDVLLKKKSPVILTPHPGELARLCGVTVQEIKTYRFGYAQKLAEKYGVTVLAKSAETFAIDPTGEAYVIDQGNTALSKGGSGDMLAGITASLTAQGVQPVKAAALASFLLGYTAELAASERSERGIIAQDILAALPDSLYVLENIAGRKQG